MNVEALAHKKRLVTGRHCSLNALSSLGVLDLGPKGEVEMVVNCILPET